MMRMTPAGSLVSTPSTHDRPISARPDDSDSTSVRPSCRATFSAPRIISVAHKLISS